MIFTRGNLSLSFTKVFLKQQINILNQENKYIFQNLANSSTFLMILMQFETRPHCRFKKKILLVELEIGDICIYIYPFR